MASRIPRLPLHRLPRIPSQQVLLLSSGRGARRRLGYAALLLLAAAVLLALHLALRPSPHYVLVIDAGSSGTRMYAYTWRDARGGPALAVVPSTAAPHAVPRRALPSKRAYQRVETEPGLDQFVDDAPGLEARALGEGAGGHGAGRTAGPSAWQPYCLGAMPWEHGKRSCPGVPAGLPCPAPPARPCMHLQPVR